MEKDIPGIHLRYGSSRSCGCLKDEKLRERASLPDGQAAKNGLIYRYKNSAVYRNLPWLLSDEAFFSLVLSNCFYCGIEPQKIFATVNGGITYNGIDRLDNDLGYEDGNVVACCEICNLAKRDLSYSEFSVWLKRVARFQKEIDLGE